MTNIVESLCGERKKRGKGGGELNRTHYLLYQEYQMSHTNQKSISDESSK